MSFIRPDSLLQGWIKTSRWIEVMQQGRIYIPTVENQRIEKKILSKSDHYLAAETVFTDIKL